MVRIFRNVHRAKDVTQMIKSALVNSKGLEGFIKRMEILKAGDGYALTEWKVEQAFTNPFGTLHGGMIATLIDQVSSMAVNTHEKVNWRINVSLNIYVTYIKGADVGDLLQIEAKTVSVGKSVANIDAVIKNLTTGQLVAKGTKVKYILPDKNPGEKKKNVFLPDANEE